jgi:AraC-like DNA-binding protein
LRQREKLQQLFTDNPLLVTKAIKCTPLDAEFLNKARDILEENYMDGDFTTLNFCEKLALNRNSVNNKIKAFTNLTTSEYIKNFRLEKAMHMLIGSNESINNIVMDAGFNSPQVFNKAFKVRFKCTPKEYRSANRQA